MIKISLLLISIFSLLYGLVFSFAPYFFAELTQAEATNIAWLRNMGASISGVLFVGLLLVYKSPNKNYDLFMVITITSTLQTLGLIFNTTRKWAIIVRILKLSPSIIYWVIVGMCILRVRSDQCCIPVLRGIFWNVWQFGKNQMFIGAFSCISCFSW